MASKVPKLSSERRKTVPGTPKMSDLTFPGPKSGLKVVRGGLAAAGCRSAAGAPDTRSGQQLMVLADLSMVAGRSPMMVGAGGGGEGEGEGRLSSL
ncbi:hypothetical protein M5K25_018056 [Dendrobium thyrsiflorum]|uniref:Uncharacterized protein n=1 Tax=Dendrobium thyrsiflorum TaxID=117978 RepID=A0ABD0UHP2_DENTH